MDLTFTNRFTETLPADQALENHRRQVREACYSRVEPVMATKPRLVAHSAEIAAQLGLSDVVDTEDFAHVFTGNTRLEGMDPYAACYGGHQFGNWAGQLGDGRAIALGEVRTSAGSHLTLQLKGAGPTPYSRTADGFAVLRSSIREFLCSEAMFHLGVPTTRALSLTLTGDAVVRDMLYDGHPRPEPGAIVCRVAPSFTRFGNFEILAARQELDIARQLLDFTIRTDFPELLSEGDDPTAATYAAMFAEVARRTAALMVEWMRVGFVHGVMNTDNMSITGLTIDYGPYGWVDDFDLGWTPNTTDSSGRYSFGNQPRIGQWNLLQLANALYPLIGDAAPLQEALDGYVTEYETGYRTMMAAKLGLDVGSAVDTLVEQLPELLSAVETDMTIFFRRLADVPVSVVEDDDEQLAARLADATYAALPDAGGAGRTATWLRSYLAVAARDGRSDANRAAAMHAVNPKYVLRNYLAQQAIDKAEAGDHSMVTELLEVMRHPYDDQPSFERYAGKRPDWARNRPGCSQLSCSS